MYGWITALAAATSTFFGGGEPAELVLLVAPPTASAAATNARGILTRSRFIIAASYSDRFRRVVATF
jgi:hypothetical protein